MKETRVFLSGGTGYLGRPLCGRLLERGCHVTVLARTGSESKVPHGSQIVLGNALDAGAFSADGCDCFMHLTGTPHPAPWKEKQFRAVDLASLRASAEAARRSGVAHFVYVSVAHPAPVMRAYIQVRRECEEILAGIGIACTILRPWYVTGPGHRWAQALQPVYALAERWPPTAEGARRLGLVTLDQMVVTLAWAVEHPPQGTRILEVPEIRSLGAL
jgi:uncharacterized protein YbjT (DUF2867 family)